MPSSNSDSQSDMVYPIVPITGGEEDIIISIDCTTDVNNENIQR
jgi:hypothetical protein